MPSVFYTAAKKATTVTTASDLDKHCDVILQAVFKRTTAAGLTDEQALAIICSPNKDSRRNVVILTRRLLRKFSRYCLNVTKVMGFA